MNDRDKRNAVVKRSDVKLEQTTDGTVADHRLRYWLPIAACRANDSAKAVESFYLLAASVVAATVPGLTNESENAIAGLLPRAHEVT